MRLYWHAAALLLACNTMLTGAFTVPKRVSSPIPASSSKIQLNAVQKEFENDGMFFFMQPFLPLLGFKEGRTTFFGPTVEVEESEYPSEEEQLARRKRATEEMTNIGQDERDRRRLGGEIAFKVAIAYAIASSIFLDDGSFNGHLARFAVILPAFFASGYEKSADRGL